MPTLETPPEKRPGFATGLRGLGVALLLTACSTSPLSRIDANRSTYESWPVEMQEAVLNGQAKPGMTPEMVEMALGKPTEVSSRTSKDGLEEIWSYKKSSAKIPAILGVPQIGIGGNVGGISVGTNVPMGRNRSSSRAPANAEDQEIVFQNGVVIRGSP